MKKNLYIELFRFIACFGVVFIHVHPKDALASRVGSIFSLFCVPFFYYVSFSFFAQNISRSNILQKSATRLFMPYFFWNLVYLAVRLFKEQILHKNEDSLNIIHALLFGSTAEHLYFVPVLIFVQALAFGLFHLFQRDTALAILKKLAFVVVLLLIGLAAQNQKVWGWKNIFEQFVRIVLAGVIVLNISRVQSKPWKIAITSAALLGLVLLLSYGSSSVQVKLAGLFVTIIAFAFPWEFPFPAIEKLSRLFFPVYLIHVFILGMFTFLFDLVLKVSFVPNVWQTLLYSSFLFALSAFLHLFLVKILSFYRKMF